MVSGSTSTGHHPPDRLREIVALRGVAALCVVIFHFKVMTTHPGGLIGLNNPVGRWGNAYLWTAVDLFFVISGFIFAHVYLRDGRLNAKTTLWGYAVARVARIYPLHLLTLLLIAAIVWAGAPLAPSFSAPAVNYDGYHFALNLMMLQGSGVEHGFSFNSPSWSLTSEFVCYALFYLFARAGGGWLVIGGVAAITLGLAADLQVPYLPVPTRISRGLVGFFIGVFLRRYRQPLGRIPFVIVASLSVIALVTAPFLDRGTFNAGIMMSFVAWHSLVLTCLHPFSAKLLNSRPTQFLGDLSYSTYLIHIPLALVFLTVNDGRYFNWSQFVWFAPCYLLALLMLSRLSFVYFEEPARRRIRQSLQRG